MGSRVFKTIPPHNLVFEILDDVCSNEEECFLVSEQSFKLMKHRKLLDEFYDRLEPYYHVSKKGYLQNKGEYSNFLTIMRQLCKAYCVAYVSKTLYTHSCYSRSLLIYAARNNWKDGLVIAKPNPKLVRPDTCVAPEIARNPCAQLSI